LFKRVLVPVDGSEHSKKALTHAIGLAKEFEGEITLVHVYSGAMPLITPAMDTLTPPPLPSPTMATVATKLREDAQKMGGEILAEAELTVKEHRISAKMVLREGDAVREIVAVAESEKVDLIVMGHRGMSKLKEILLGSVSEGVVRKAPYPVLIVK